MIRPRRVVSITAFAIAGLALVACGDGSGSGATTTAPSPITNPAVPTTAPASPTTSGGGGMHAGAPRFVTFEASSSVACTDGNAEVTLSYTTENVVGLAIKIGDGSFAETAGYGPNETAVVASIPCSGAATSSVQMKGCTEDGECAESPVRHVTITG